MKSTPWVTLQVRRLVIASALPTIVMAACTASPESDAVAVAAAVPNTSASTLAAFPMTRPALSPADVAAIASPMASVLYGASTPPSLLDVLSRSTTSDGAVFADVSDIPGLKVAHTGANSATVVFNARVTRDTASLNDVGRPAAQRVFETAFQSLIDGGVLPRTGLNIANVRQGSIIQTEGLSGQPPTQRVKEYVFTVPRTVNGIEILNGGFEASVHRSGQLARLKTFGPRVQSSVAADGSEVPMAAGYTFVPSIAKTATDARVAAAYPKAQISSLGLRYWLPEGTSSAVVEPRQMYFIVPTATIEGHAIHGRGFYVAYSTRESSSAPTVWPVPSPGGAVGNQK